MRSPKLDNRPTPCPDQDIPCTGDRLLRRYGFLIHSRPACGPNLWERRGRLYTELEATNAANYERQLELAAIEDQSK